jgi:hypothetical protein
VPENATVTPETGRREIAVAGEIRTIACREGSSGIFTGDLEGLYQGYRFGSSEPDERRETIEAPHGTLALVLRQQIVTPLPPRPAVHPFAGGRDPFAEPRPAGGPPPHAQKPGTEGGKPIFKRVHYMETTVRIDPGASSGIFAGAEGELEFTAPQYRMPGHLVIQTDDGDLCLRFLEKGSRETLNADLWVDGERSTGRYAGAEGELTFALKVTPPFFGEGPYEGTIRLAAARS